jgi:hypothetical protein
MSIVPKEAIRDLIKQHNFSSTTEIMKDEYSDAIVHPFRKFSASLSGETEHCFPDRVQSLN